MYQTDTNPEKICFLQPRIPKFLEHIKGKKGGGRQEWSIKNQWKREMETDEQLKKTNGSKPSFPHKLWHNP